MPHRLDLQKGTQSFGARCRREVRKAFRPVDPLDCLGRGLLQRLAQLSICTSDVQGVDVRMCCEVWSKFGGSTGQEEEKYGLETGLALPITAASLSVQPA
jgi:hypothetical protein